MGDQLALVDDAPQLTPRQQAAYDLIANHRNGVNAADIGANWHAIRGKHPADTRCDYCDTDGRDVVRSKALRPLVTYRRTPHGNQYILRNGQPAAADPAGGAQLLGDLPGETWEDAFLHPPEAAA